MVDKLSDAEVKEYHCVFDEYKTSNNEVEYRYLEKMLRKLGYDPSESEMESVYEHLDVFGHGTVSFPHFLTLMANKFSKEDTDSKGEQKNGEDEELLKEMKEAFKVFDGDGNGFISQAELKHSLHKMGERLSDEEIEDMMKEADLDGDGQISFPEFCRMITLQEMFG